MANQLKVGWVETIYTLLERGWSRRRIARTLGIDRGTVIRYANKARAPANAAGVPPGSNRDGAGDSTACADPNAAGAPPGSGGLDATSADADAPARPPVQPSRCEAFREIILTKLEQGLSAKRIHQDLVRDHDFDAEYHSVRRFVRRLGQARPLPFRRMECAPGDEAQVDFGKGAPVVRPTGKPDLLIIDDFGMKQLPKRSGEYLFEIIMRRHEVRSTIMTSNRPLEDWGKLIGDVPAATAILDRFLHHAVMITISGKSYWLRNKAATNAEPDAKKEPPESDRDSGKKAC